MSGDCTGKEFGSRVDRVGAVMKSFALASVSVVALLASNAGKAADIAAPVYGVPVAVYSWTGCYIGGNVGEAWSRQNANESAVPFAPASVSANKSGVIGGVHAGCNVQGTYGVARGWVFGIEADWSGAKLDDTQTVVLPPGSGVVAFTESTKSLVSIRGRAGVTILPNVLLYATAGVVWNHTDYAGLHTFTACPDCSAVAFSSTNFGWVSGGGLEWALWNSNWIARIEGLYYIVHGASPGGIQPSTGAQTSVWYWNNLGIAEGRVGLSYKFGYAPVASR